MHNNSDSPNSSLINLFASVPKGLESLLVKELTELGAQDPSSVRAGVSFKGSLETAYRVCLWSRVASRILMPIKSVSAGNVEELYEAANKIAWEEHLNVDQTLTVEFQGTNPAIKHTRFGAQLVKDAVVDRFRDRTGQRPSVDFEAPDLRINVLLRQNQAYIGIDLSGESLHRRGYRPQGAPAPLKENLAASILLLGNWGRGKPLIDPMCGSGTLVIEAAMIAGSIAPALNRKHFGFSNWLKHDEKIWQKVLGEAQQKAEQGRLTLPPLFAYDSDESTLDLARESIENAGLTDAITVENRPLGRLEPPEGVEGGLVVVNPPYGQRMGRDEDLRPLYQQLGDILKTRFAGWRAMVITSDARMSRSMGLYAHRNWTVFNGSLRCTLSYHQMHQASAIAERQQRAKAQMQRRMPAASNSDSVGGTMFANRIRKNKRRLGRWLRRQGVQCYRLYDADMPEYAVAVDVYKDWVHVQEYKPPSTVDPERAAKRLQEALIALEEVLKIPKERIVLKERKIQKGESQYQRQNDDGNFIEVEENGLKFLVNLTDYLDTGLFLDHAATRTMIGEMARGRSFLNLFGYTGAATVYAAAGGADETVTVDLSNTYLNWAEKNLKLNGLLNDPARHQLIRADVIQWLTECDDRFDLIFLDPPTFSNSKKMDDVLDIQRDHVELIRNSAALLNRGGVLIFSTNRRKFQLDQDALSNGLSINEISRATLRFDFQRQPWIHRCWQIVRQN
ncbi:MAG: bifunctional 23S rRNA (guanine(2069)-N(7))-methyltransferase RlmK/23S rRNA (guanine(2445)-N(2))-methyltransferase RlmL [Magnetococcales bacterium]|nr:bifunctional 23S rRNA (guanine(2069)-N(7))-methyltransferase RlmK/23S rRNA (guanine(2445)-N(2))-methyltransferase RlmL [Magnetococcales bacterium]